MTHDRLTQLKEKYAHCFDADGNPRIPLVDIGTPAKSDEELGINFDVKFAQTNEGGEFRHLTNDEITLSALEAADWLNGLFADSK